MKDFKIIEGYKHIRYSAEGFSEEETLKKSKAFFDKLEKRRSVRDFSSKTIPRKVINNLIKSASTAPSGAHKQPWTFCVIENPEIKKQIRIAAEKEERESYEGRMNEEWVKDLKPLGTDWQKPFLEIAPYLIIVFKKPFYFDENGNKKQNYYVPESVGLACGFLINAIHNAGLVTLTHTPSPMKFLTKILDRPVNERPFLLLPVGYPASEIYVPDIKRKSLEEVAVYY
jgi:iodotyrosine deiodinase